MPYRALVLFAVCALVACASGPHPALQVASSDLGCEQSGMKLHQIYPKKVRIEGCGKEAIYVDACNGYGVEATCGWGRQYATEFEREAAEREKVERADIAKRQSEEKKAEREAAEQAEAEQEKVAKAEKENADTEKASAKKAEQENSEKENGEKENVTAKKAEEQADSDDEKPKSETAKPEGKSAKRRKGAKKSDGIEDFLK